VGGEYSYTCVLPDGFFLKAIVFRVCEHDYMNIQKPPPPQKKIIASNYGPENDYKENLPVEVHSTPASSWCSQI
jgi:hypothetical protein